MKRRLKPMITMNYRCFLMKIIYFQCFLLIYRWIMMKLFIFHHQKNETTKKSDVVHFNLTLLFLWKFNLDECLMKTRLKTDDCYEIPMFYDERFFFKNYFRWDLDELWWKLLIFILKQMKPRRKLMSFILN